jgi:hypothetical protein
MIWGPRMTEFTIFFGGLQQWLFSWGFLPYTVPPNGSTVILSVFSQVFTMCKMVICSMYIIWKIFYCCQDYIKWLDFTYYNNIIFYISDNTHTTHATYEYHSYHTKKTGGTKLISTVRSLHIGLFYIIYESFSTGGRVILCTLKNIFFLLEDDGCICSTTCPPPDEGSTT